MRALIILLFCCSSVLANDIYVSQAPSNTAPTEENKPAFIEQKPVSSEKELISNTPNNTYCSVVAGCTESK